jgi:parallel beta-helix repeat protein
MKTKIFLLSLIILNVLLGKTINIPSDYSTIQAGLNAADSGDVVNVSAGTYYENIFWPNKNGIQLVGQDSSNTIIDGGGNGSVMHMSPSNASIDTTTLIQNFTIANGGNVNYGGGLMIKNSNPKLVSLFLKNNSANNCGGGMYCDFSSPIFSSSTIFKNSTNNSSSYEGGGGVYLINSSPLLTNVVILENFVNSYIASGGGIYCGSKSSPTFLKVFILNNSTNGRLGTGGGIRFNYSYPPPLLSNVIISGNSSENGGGIYCKHTSPVLTNVIIADNLANNRGGGIYFQELCSPNIENITINSNSDGIFINSSNPTIKNCNFTTNGIAIENIDNSYIINASNNWFDYISGPYHPIQNPTGKGDSVNTYVNITPWLTSPSIDASPIPIQNFTIKNTGNDYVTLFWDSSKLSDLSKYRIYFNNNGNNFYQYTDSIDVNKTDTTITITGLQLGQTYYFSGITIDNDGNKSWYSEELSAMTRNIEVQNISISNESDLQHIVNHSPILCFKYYDSMNENLSKYQINISTKSNFSDIDIWDSGMINSSDTSIIYNENNLIDGMTYYLRVKAGNDDYLSDWHSISFRMNSKPTIPNITSPSNSSIIDSTTVTLKIENSSDDENDLINYEFSLFSDSNLNNKIDSTSISEIGWQPSVDLDDNQQYWVTVIAYDGYEYSEKTDTSSFIINFENDAPTNFSLITPADSTEVTTLLPFLDWENATDADPVDTVYYTISLGRNLYDMQEFNIGIESVYQIENQLNDNATYYWKVYAKDLNGAITENQDGYHTFYTNTSNENPYSFNLITPTLGSVEIDLTPVFYWENKGDPDINDNIIYKLYFDIDSNFTETIPIQLDSNCYIPTNLLLDNSEYYWKVVASDQTSEFSTEIWNFWTNTKLEPPEPFDLLSPINNATGLATNINFIWRKSNDNDPQDYATYKLIISKDEAFAEKVFEINTNLDTVYSLIDKLPDNAQYYWKVIAGDTDSLLTESEIYSFTLGSVSVDERLENMPNKYELYDAYPNPFNPTTTIKYSLPTDDFVKITIFNSMGKKIKILINQKQNAGYHTISWDAENLPSGIYMYRMESSTFSKVKKCLLVK